MRCLLGLLLIPTLSAASPSPEQIVERAVDAVDRAREAERALEYRFEHVYERTAGPEQGEADRYEVEPLGDEHFYRLVERNGRPASTEDLRREERLKTKFRGLFRSEDDERAGAGFELDRKLLERYRVVLLGEAEIEGRSAWAVGFRPREDSSPPIERRIDYALNRLEGVLWIDREDYGLAGAEFRLSREVKVWGGLLADVDRLEGRIRMTRLEPGLWMPAAMELELTGRVLFDSLDRGVRMSWFNFERVTGSTQRR